VEVQEGCAGSAKLAFADVPVHDNTMAAEKIDLHPGDKIHHAKFGDGIVVSIDGDELLVAFADLGAKRLSLSFAPVEKI
jgi:DNA helicase-2/ATP-dependent DNA helicase PcrA